VTDTSLFIAVVANQLNRITIEITHSDIAYVLQHE